MPPPRLLAIDLDGTLFNSRQQVSPRNVQALQRARHAGVEICIATGRRHTFAWRHLDALELAPQDVLISANGAVVRCRDGRLLARTDFPRETSVELCAVTGEHRNRLVFTFDKVDADPAADRHAGSILVESLQGMPGGIERWIEDNRADMVEASPLESGLTEERAIQAMIYGDVGLVRDVETHLRKSSLGAQLAILRTEYRARSFAFLDILPAGCSKGAALAALAGLRGLRREEIAAIGDNFNDVDMLAFAGRSFITANGAPEMLAASAVQGWSTVPSNDEDGVAVAIDALLAD